jgi:hypothetical protein
MADLDLTALSAAVSQITDAANSAEKLVQDLAAMVKNAAAPLVSSPDPVAVDVLQKINDLTSGLAAKASELAAAVVANTPAGPNPLSAALPPAPPASS